MEYKKLVIFICIIICLFSISSVCASDANQTVVANDEINQQLDLSDVDTLSASADDMQSDDSIKMSSDDNDTLNLNDDEIVSKADSSLSNVGDFPLEYGSEASITVQANGATGITAKIDDNPIDVSGFTIMIPLLDIGTHKLSVTTIPDDDHNPITKTATITVNKAESLRDIDDVTFSYGNSSKVIVVTSGATKITAKIDGNDVNVNGNVISIPVLDVGTYTLSVTTVPDDNHISTTKTATITIIKADSSVGIKDLNLTYGKSSNITVTTIGATKFTAKIDDKSVEVVGNKIIVPELDVGVHTLSVTTVPDSNHNPVTRTSKLTVSKADSLINIQDVNLTYGSSFSFELNNDDGVTKFTAKIDGKNVDIIEDILIIPKLEVGSHTLTVSIVKDANHDSATKTAKITVTKAKTNLVVHNLNVTVGQKVTLTVGMGGVELPNEGVIVFYDGKTEIGQANVKRGIAELTYTPLKSGVHTISVVYNGTSRFESSKSSLKLTVYEKTNYTYVTNSSLVIIPSSDGSSDDATAVINFPSDATGIITLTISGTDYKSDMVNGVAKIDLPDLADGVYPYIISYSGDEQYSPFTANGTFNVTKTPSDNNESDDSKVIIDFPSTFGRIPCGSSVPIDLPDDATGIITLTINGALYDSYIVENGAVTVKMPDLGYGDYPFTITYSGDDKYLLFARDGTLYKTVPAVAPVISASNANVVYSAGSYYTIKVTGTDGKLANGVTVKISGKISKTLKTTNGVAKFKITQAPGSYKITISALGKSITRTITVKHLVTLKSVTVKKSAKKLVLQATLGKINGKYLNKKTVTFKFNGKTYKAKTDSKGIAKVTITSSVLKKLKVGKSLTYQATYVKDTVKKTVKIKK